MSTEQEVEDINLEGQHVGLQTNSQKLKCLHVPEKPIPKMKMKASKTSIDPITLTEGDLFDNGETVHNVTKDVLEEVRME